MVGLVSPDAHTDWQSIVDDDPQAMMKIVKEGGEYVLESREYAGGVGFMSLVVAKKEGLVEHERAEAEVGAKVLASMRLPKGEWVIEFESDGAPLVTSVDDPMVMMCHSDGKWILLDGEDEVHRMDRPDDLVGLARERIAARRSENEASLRDEITASALRNPNL